MEILLLLVALGIAGAVPLEELSVCQPHSRPWQVRVGSSCSGALIDQWWIATSLSCSGSSVTAILGDYDATVDEGTEQYIETDLTILHSPYRSPLNSLVMMRLSKPAKFNQYVQPIPLPSSCPQPGKTCHVSGWGSTVPNQYEPPNKIKCISVPVVADDMCRILFPMFWSPGMVCAGQADINNCLNDRGAVMVCDGQLQGIQWYTHGCMSPPDPSSYTKICTYTSWMRDVMRRNAPVLPTTLPPTFPPMKKKDDKDAEVLESVKINSSE